MADQPGCDTHAMVLVHRVFRREFRALPHLVRACGDADRQRAELVGGHAAELIEVLHHHHSAEDTYLWPVLRGRDDVDRAAIDRMDAQHERMAEILERVERLLPDWRASGDAGLGEAIASRLDLLYVALDEHLDDEEAHVLPVVARTLTKRQWRRVGDSAMSAMPRRRLVVFVGAILEDADETERRNFLALVPLPGRIGYRLIGRRTHRLETAALRLDPSTTANERGNI